MREKLINGHEDYTITDDGRVYSSVRNKYLKPYSCHRGHLRVQLNGKHVFVHRLVAQAFIPNPNNLPFINHIDCDPANNTVGNLEWCTAKQNTQHAVKLSRHVSVRNQKIRPSEVSAVKMLRDKGHTLASIANRYGVTVQCIWQTLRKPS